MVRLKSTLPNTTPTSAITAGSGSVVSSDTGETASPHATSDKAPRSRALSFISNPPVGDLRTRTDPELHTERPTRIGIGEDQSVGDVEETFDPQTAFRAPSS